MHLSDFSSIADGWMELFATSKHLGNKLKNVTVYSKDKKSHICQQFLFLNFKK